jgi:uncharacterized protein (DUF58 family)
VIRRTTPLAFAVAALVGWTLFLGVLVDRAELLILAVPLAIGLLSAGSRRPPPRISVEQQLSADRLSEGDRLFVTVTVAAEAPIPIVELFVPLPSMLQVHGAITGSFSIWPPVARRIGPSQCCAPPAAVLISELYI